MLSHDRTGEHPRGDIGQLILLAIFMAVWATDSFVLRFSTFLAKAVPLWVRWPLAGLLLITAGYLVYRSHDVLQVAEGGKRLWTGGVFARVRHPMYLGAWLAYFGFVLSTLSLASLAVLSVILPFYDRIAEYEERFLESLFGREYANYKARVPKWIPWLRKSNASGLHRRPDQASNT
jgi:protein-S-isoprenylcysteine O-methyltransferase Ste14